MQCPSCKEPYLKPVKLDQGLPAHGCGRCEGALVSLLYYRDWAERSGAVPDYDKGPLNPADVVTNDTAVAMNCPKCKRLMTKFNMDGAISNRVDLCTSCDEAWLDGGEWALLQALQLNTTLPSVFTDAWQKKVRREQSEQKRRERFTRMVGEEDIERADEVRRWLCSHPKRQELLFYIGQD